MNSKKRRLILKFVFMIFVVVGPTLSYSGSSNYDYEYEEVQRANETSIIQKAKNWWNKNKPGREKELERLELELEANEKLLRKTEEKMAGIVNNAPYCPTGADGKAAVVFENDPRVELRRRIADLKVRIAEME